MSAGTATKRKNLSFVRTGLTINSRVYQRGEVARIPDGYIVLSEEEQLERFKKVFYTLTDEDPNVGQGATGTFVPRLEVASSPPRPMPSMARSDGAGEVLDKGFRGASSTMSEEAEIEADLALGPAKQGKAIHGEKVRAVVSSATQDGDPEEVARQAERESLAERRAMGTTSSTEPLRLVRKHKTRKKTLVEAKPTKLRIKD